MQEIKDRLKKEYEDLDSMLKQKSRAEWLSQGACNSKFFQDVISKRRRRNNILGTWHNNLWITEPTQLKEALAAHFEDRFADWKIVSCFHIGHLINIKITTEEAIALENNISLEEIFLTLKEMDC